MIETFARRRYMVVCTGIWRGQNRAAGADPSSSDWQHVGPDLGQLVRPDDSIPQQNFPRCHRRNDSPGMPSIVQVNNFIN